MAKRYINFNTDNKEKLSKNLILGLTIFFAISGIWIGTISHKYDELTFGTTGNYNQKLIRAIFCRLYLNLG